MNHLRLSTTAFLLIVLFTVVGCTSGEEKPGQDKTSTPVVASPQDQTDARTAALHVLSQFEAGQFAQIYQEASPGFKKIGTEPQFVAKFQQTLQKTGPLKNPKEISFATLPGKGHVLVYRLENEHFKTDMRISLARSTSGKMELAGLNQHDEPKK